ASYGAAVLDQYTEAVVKPAGVRKEAELELARLNALLDTVSARVEPMEENVRSAVATEIATARTTLLAKVPQQVLGPLNPDSVRTDPGGGMVEEAIRRNADEVLAGMPEWWQEGHPEFGWT